MSILTGILLALVAQDAPADHDRVRSIVEGLVGPTHVEGMPEHFEPRHALTIESRQEIVGRELDEEGPEVVRDFADVILESRNYDTTIFGNMAECREVWLESTLKVWLIAYGSFHGLEPEELAKLYLAGRVDIKRLMDRIELGRVRFEAVRQDYRSSLEVLERYSGLRHLVESGPFDEGSFFAKTLTKILKDRTRADQP